MLIICTRGTESSAKRNVSQVTSHAARFDGNIFKSNANEVLNDERRFDERRQKANAVVSRRDPFPPAAAGVGTLEMNSSDVRAAGDCGDRIARMERGERAADIYADVQLLHRGRRGIMQCGHVKTTRDRFPALSLSHGQHPKKVMHGELLSENESDAKF